MPLSAATTRYGSSAVVARRRRGGGTTWPSDQVVGEVEQPAHQRAVLLRRLVVERVAVGGAGAVTKPPLEPPGTITAFFTICVFTSPRISVRKSSGRSLQRMPPRATGAAAQVHALHARRAHADLVEQPASAPARRRRAERNLNEMYGTPPLSGASGRAPPRRK